MPVRPVRSWRQGSRKTRQRSEGYGRERIVGESRTRRESATAIDRAVFMGRTSAALGELDGLADHGNVRGPDQFQAVCGVCPSSGT